MNTLNFFQKYKRMVKIASFTAIFLGFVLMIFAFRGGEIAEETDLFTPKVTLINVAQLQKSDFRLTTTGLVESFEQVELRSQVSAQVKKIYLDIGDQISIGQVLVSFENDGLAAQLLQAQAGLDAENVRLAELKRGARSEELQIVQTQVLNAQIAVEDAEINLANAQNQAETNLTNVYASSLITLQSAADLGKNSILLLSDFQNTYFEDYTQESLDVQDGKAIAIFSFLGESSAGRWLTKFVSELTGGIFGLVNSIPNSQDFNQIDAALSEMLNGLSLIRQGLSSVTVSSALSSADRASLAAEKGIIDSQIAAVTGSQQAILSQNLSNQSSIDNAQRGLNNALSLLENTQNQLILIESGASSEQIAAQEARVKLARASVLQVQALLNKTIIRSPISGILAVLSIRLEELVSPGQLVASVVNKGGLEIKAYIESANLNKLSLGDQVIIENSVNGFVNRIAPSIDPMTKKVEVEIVVSEPAKSNLVIGQFVDLDILASNGVSSENIYLVPLEAVRTKTDGSLVYLVDQENHIVEQLVVLGNIIGESIEVIRGIVPGMKIVSLVRGLEPGQLVEKE